MIERYRRDVMHAVFTEEAKFNAYLEVEIATLDAWSTLGVIPKEDVKKIRETASFRVERIYEIEAETCHDIVAFTRAVSESLGAEKKWVHYGLTSTDVVDTAMGYLYRKANDILQEGLERFGAVLRQNALRYKTVPCIGRTHGVHADITSFGLKWALWYDEWNRHMKRFSDARAMIEVGKISGAVGNFANTPPAVQDAVCDALGIGSANISTQTLQRDRHAQYLFVLALIGATMEKIALEIRHLQRTEVREVEEAFHAGQKGSSAMPHKRNPIASENITGVARMLKGYMVAGFDNIPLWHERDISHSSVERVVLPDAIQLLDYALHRYANVLENLTVFEERMIENIHLTQGVVFSQRVLTRLIEKGLSREDAYDLVQPLAMRAWQEHTPFRGLLEQNETVGIWLNKEELDELFQLEYYLRNVDLIYQRVGLI
jgi:adenylosuccinate lyase